MKASWLVGLIFFLALGCAAPGAVGPSRGESENSISEAAGLEELVGEFVRSQGYPNLAVGVVRGPELVWSRGWGAGAGEEPPDARTVFRIGSITKVITATAALALVEEGVLSLDDEVARWLPELAPILSPPDAEPVRLRHLLGHSSGIPGLGNGRIDWSRAGARIAEADLLAAMEGVELDFTPGSSHAYSNLAVGLAGLIVARASGRDYRALVQERILEPLGMEDASWDPPRRGLAPGHHRSPTGGYQRAATSWSLGAMEPAGGLYASIRDLARLASFGLGHSSVLRPETLALSQRRIGGIHGLGWLVGELTGAGALVWHNGSTGDYGAYLGLLPERDLGVVLLLGSGELGDLEELESLGRAILARLVDPTSDVRPRASATPRVAIEVVARRLLALTSAPTPEAIEEAFEPAFFASVPRDAILRFFQEGVAATGACTAYELLEDRGAGAFHLRLDCERGQLAAEVIAYPAAPNRMRGLLISAR